jgi:hypothetical protein
MFPLPLWTVWIPYGALLVLIGGLGIVMHTRGNRGKLSRAFFVATLAGIFLPCVTAAYNFLAPQPVPPPPPPVHSLHDFMVNIAQAAAFGGASEVILILSPPIVGIGSITIAFVFSFFFPMANRQNRSFANVL